MQTEKSTNTIGANLRCARETRGYTQAQLAERAGLNKCLISFYETGARMPSVKNLIKLSDALLFSADYLIARGEV